MKKHLTTILHIIQIFLLLFIVYQLYQLDNRNSRTGSRTESRKRNVPKKININMSSLIQNSAFKGDENAKVTIIKYNSFSCGYCKKAKATLDQVFKKYRKGVKLVYKHFVRNQEDLLTAQIVECAGEQGKFWETYDSLFEKGFNGNFNILSENAGLNTKQLRSCIESGKYRKKILNDTKTGRSFGINGTPAFIINGKLSIGYKPFNAFDALIRAEMR